MTADQWLAFTIWIMDIALMLLVVACIERYVQQNGNPQKSHANSPNPDRSLTWVKRNR